MTDRPTTPAPSLNLQVLGCPELRREGQPVKCGQFGLRILAVLALDGPTHRLKLADLLWDAPTARALHNLRMALHKLRHALGTHASLLQEKNGHLSLDLTRLHVDALHHPHTPSQEFLSGHRCDGPESWLEWVGQVEERLSGKPDPAPELAPSPAPAGPRRHPGGLALLYALDAAAEMDDGRYDTAIQAAQHAVNLCPHSEGAALAHDTLAYLAFDRDEFTQASQHLQQGFLASPDPPWELFYTAASLADMQGNATRAEQLTMHGLKALRRHSSPALLQAVTASAYDNRGDFATARRWHELALASARAWPRPGQHCGTLTFFLWHLNATREPARSRTLAHEALGLGEFGMTSYVRNSLGIAALNLGDPETALNELSPQVLLSTGLPQIIALAKSALAYHQIGEHDLAQQFLTQCEPLAVHNENGRARYEWAVAALTLDPERHFASARRMVQGHTTNDFLLVQRYRQLYNDLLARHPHLKQASLTDN